MKGLTLEERREIERMYNAGESTVNIAKALNRASSTIYTEFRRGFTGEYDKHGFPVYSAELGNEMARVRQRRKGNRHAAMLKHYEEQED